MLFVGLFLPEALFSQDTVRRTTLDEISITEQGAPATLRTQAPTQVATIEKIEQSGAIQLSDVVRQMAGVTLKDYGGVGGMKTVSARGLGSQFSTLTIDGVAVNDAQNGQIDLGRYSLGNTAYVSLSQGQPDNLLQSARTYAAGSVLNMETQVPHFFLAERTNLKVGLDAGSFALWSPSVLWEQKLSDKILLSLWVNHLRTDGDYPFVLYYTGNRDDSSSHERRTNSQMHSTTADANLFYSISSRQTLTAKVHMMSGFHALPGPVQHYAEKGSEFTRETLAFAQVRWRGVANNWQWQVIGKYQYNYDFYEDTAFANVSHYLSNQYRQHESYLSGAAVWNPVEKLSFSLSTDAALNSFSSDITSNYNRVTRGSLQAVAAAQFKTKRIVANANVLATVTHEVATKYEVEGSERPADYRRLSPYAGITVQPFANIPLRARYFFKETYRVPNFSEMYFFAYVKNLRPERAEQHNFGLTWNHYVERSEESSTQIAVTADAYLNTITDKLVAQPAQNMFLWQMYNMGKVRVTGLDFKADAMWQWPRTALTLSATYTYQRAVNRTDPDNERTYNNQIPYTPRHSGGMQIYFEMPWVNVGYTAMFVGERYCKEQNAPEYRMPPYADQGISVDRLFDVKLGTLRLKAQVLNLFDVQYEVVRSYPMMGRNYRFGAVFEF